VPVESQPKLVEKAEDIEVVNPSAMFLAAVSSIFSNKYTRTEFTAENVTSIVVTLIKAESVKFNSIGKCIKEALLDVTEVMMEREATVQFTFIVTFSKSCDDAPAALTGGIRAGLTFITMKQTTRKDNSNSCLIIYLNSRYFFFDNKTLLQAHD
jgi:hypothetical protein